MNKKILLLVSLLLVGGAMAAVMISRSGEGQGPSEPDPVGVASLPGVSVAPAQPPTANPAASPVAPAGTAKPGAAEVKLTEAQKTKIIELLRQAGKAYVEGKHQNALRLANESLDLDPRNSLAVQIAGTAACALKMQSNAQAMFNRLSPGSPKRRLLVRICTRHGVQLAAGPQLDSGTSPTAVTAPGTPGAPGEAAGAPAKAPQKKLSSTSTRSTIRMARKSIVGCMKDRKGLVQVRMTVEGSGKVSAAAAMGQHASTEVGACVKKEVLKLSFPPFDGPSRTFIFPFISK